MHSKLEIACFNLESAKTAADTGADRIEFAADYSCGGITPRLNDFRELRAYTSLPIYVLIRERGGNFIYSNEEISTMKNSITEFRKSGADGFVFGCLNEENQIDKIASDILLQAAHPLPCTFHRAFDRTEDPFAALKTIIDMGFRFILSSGQQKDALNGAGRLNLLKKDSAGMIEIIAGGGIRSSNIRELMDVCPSHWYHSACIIDSSEKADVNEIKNLKTILNE